MKTKNVMKFCDEVDGSFPVADFLRSLDVKTRAKVMSTISLLKENGYDLYPPFVEEKDFSKDLEALDIPMDDGTTIVIPFFIDTWPGDVTELVLTHAFTKSGPENPDSEIFRARRLINNFLDT